jgi:hypothetical protein
MNGCQEHSMRRKAYNLKSKENCAKTGLPAFAMDQSRTKFYSWQAQQRSVQSYTASVNCDCDLVWH